jgi:hypothetical protein
LSRLKLRCLRIRVLADSGTLGADLRFEDGLNVIEARNSRGKSICMQSILFALGMDAMLGPRHDLPLPDAMHKEIDTGNGISPVRESQVLLEVEGTDGEIATIARWAKHPEIKTRLISVWDGPALTGGTWSDFERHDHLIRAKGAVDSQIGFHHWLAGFVGWPLPLIQMASGVERPLYPEYLFSLLFVEQRGGWSGIQAQQPSFFVPDARERAAEFILGIDTYTRGQERRRLESEQARVARSWSDATSLLSENAEQLGFVTTGIPPVLPGAWEASEDADLVAVSTQNSLTGEIGALRERLEVAEREIGLAPTRRDTGREEAFVLGLEEKVMVLSASVRSLDVEVADEAATQEGLARTLVALKLDLGRNFDAQRVHELGAPAWTEPTQDCPTCHQLVTDIVLPAGIKPAMSLQDNIAYLRSEIDALERLQDQSVRVQDRRRLKSIEERRELSEVRAKARTARSALLAPDGTPSVAAIQEALIVRGRLETLNALEGRFAASLRHLVDLVNEGTRLTAELASIPPESPTTAETDKVRRLASLVVDQLGNYDFESFDPALVEVDFPTLRPARDGAPIGFGISASDGIRLIWAHLLGLMELSREVATRHPGLVMFDEPRQQSADPLSLAAFLERASKSVQFGQQVIIATSEERDRLLEQLEGLDHRLFEIDQRLLVPID